MKIDSAQHPSIALEILTGNSHTQVTDMQVDNLNKTLLLFRIPSINIGFLVYVIFLIKLVNF